MRYLSRLALSKRPNRVGVSPHLRTETDPVSETSCFSSNYLDSGRWTKSENPVILCGYLSCVSVKEKFAIIFLKRAV
jgi:hypothetical protein